MSKPVVKQSDIPKVSLEYNVECIADQRNGATDNFDGDVRDHPAEHGSRRTKSPRLPDDVKGHQPEQNVANSRSKAKQAVQAKPEACPGNSKLCVQHPSQPA